MEAEFTYVDSQVGLEGLVAHLRTVHEVGIDTEADNLHHYHTRVCLIQISAGEAEYLIDPLAGLDLRPLFDALADKLLIMHGSDYDLRLLWELCRFRPSEVFDTMLAAQLVGVTRFGLSSLLSELLGVDHPKDSQKSDWSRRPLPPKMVQYAARDVKHIAELRDALLARLEAAGRVEWHRQKCAWQIEVATTGFPGTDENAWRIGPSRWFSPRALAALYELWHWRDSEARRLDRPPFKVMSNEYLAQLSEAVDAGRWRDAYEALPKGLRRGSARGLAEALERGESRDPKTLPRRPENGERRQPLSALELSRQDKIRSHRDRRSHELHIDPTLIASRSQIAQLARQPDAADQVLLPWQADLLRPALEACMASW
ncbi:ribonuclease D [Opitutales bacterium ASA1]|uniref:ribonuclease D n=1 Tax=Congregicoccus parvus TaxID=3081749 RepID=UPI002B2C692C|nr:ribonuclease D [Opitutales bacterium ASA1]